MFNNINWPHKRFLVFAFAEYYPGGALDDLVGDFDTEEEALVFKDGLGYKDFIVIYDRVSGLVVFQKD